MHIFKDLTMSYECIKQSLPGGRHIIQFADVLYHSILFFATLLLKIFHKFFQLCRIAANAPLADTF